MTTKSAGAVNCQMCQGRGYFKSSAQGNVQTCPVCEGAGALQPTPARIPIFYILGPVTLAGNATLQQNIQIQTTADFEWVFTMAKYTDSRLNITMFDGSTGRLITQPQATVNANNGVIPIDLFAGTAQLPFPLLEPYIIARAASVQFTLTDTSGASNTLYLALQGFQLIPQQAPQQGSSGMVVSQQQ